MVHWELHLADVFEIPETIARADFYELYGHPYVLIDGTIGAFGALDCATAADTYRQMVQQRIEETGGMSPVAIQGSWTVENGTISLRAVHRAVDPMPGYPLRATFLIYEDGIPWCCGHGQDVWDGVVRRIRDIPVELAAPGDSVVVTAEVPVEADWNVDSLHAVAYLQGSDRDRDILQATVLIRELPAFAADPGAMAGKSRFLTLPNPLRPGSPVSFLVSERAAGWPLRLELFDAAGRLLYEHHEGEAAAGVRSWTIPLDFPRNHHGVSFLRLSTRDGAVARKIVRLD